MRLVVLYCLAITALTTACSSSSGTSTTSASAAALDVGTPSSAPTQIWIKPDAGVVALNSPGINDTAGIWGKYAPGCYDPNMLIAPAPQTTASSATAASFVACYPTSCAFQFVPTANAGLYNLQSADGSVIIYVNGGGQLVATCSDSLLSGGQVSFESLVNFWVDTNNNVRVASYNSNTAPSDTDAFLEGNNTNGPNPYVAVAQSAADTLSLQYDSADQAAASTNQGSVAVAQGPAISGTNVASAPYTACDQNNNCQGGLACYAAFSYVNDQVCFASQSGSATNWDVTICSSGLSPSFSNVPSEVCLQPCYYWQPCSSGYQCVNSSTYPYYGICLFVGFPSSSAS